MLRLSLLLQLVLSLKLPLLCVSFAAASQSSSSSSSTTSTNLKIMASKNQQIPTLEIDPLPTAAEADGRGIRLAVLDTGCDVAAAGMRKTSTGLPKYLDFIDCTGDGDVDTRTKQSVHVTDDGITTVKGASGKSLTLPSNNSIVSNEVRVGAIRLFDILPKTALRRVQADRKTQFMHTHSARMATAQTTLDQLRRRQQQSCSDSSKTDKDKDETKDDTAKTEAAALKKEIQELELLLEELQDMIKDYQDTAGPLMDVVLYQTQDGIWQALVDVHADGDLTKAQPMAPYAHKQDYGTLGFGSHVTFCIQVYENGDILSLVCDAGSHGTHVAGIAAAYFDDTDNNTSVTNNKPHNGVAPGAQILACKIGDVRVSSAETGVGLIRALIAAKRYKCHLVNLSFGEPSWQPDQGRVSKVFADAVHKWGMTIFTSAGNDGPALSSIGSPGSLSSLITVGAYVSPQMMTDQYSTLVDDSTTDPTINNDDVNNLPGASYSFSSRGPTPDGLMPDICAPGGAIAPIPRHTLQGKRQMHGTSMASPSACGAAAVVLSALPAHGIKVEDVNPHELRRALQNSAKKTLSTAVDPDAATVLDPFAQGAGLVSAARAVEYLVAHHGKPAQNVTFDVRIPASNNARGIFVRDALQLAGPMTKTVSVQPFLEHSLDKTQEEMEDLLSLELELDLIPSKPWVTCPKRMTMLSAKDRGHTFALRLDPKGLPPGAHYATVDAIDSTDPGRGPLFQVPITIIIPHGIVSAPHFRFASDVGGDEGDESQTTSTQILDAKADKPAEITTHDNGIDVSMKYDLSPGSPSRRFLSVPTSAEWASIKIRSAAPTAGREGPHSLVLHAVPFARGDLPNTMIQIKKFFQLNEGIEREFRVQVRGGSTLEVCLQLSWLANPTMTSVITDVEFHSLDVRPPTLISTQPVRISASTEWGRFGAAAPFRSEKINPKASLVNVHRTIRPKEYKISAASSDDRDVLPPSDAEVKALTTNGSNGEDNQKLADGTLIYKSNLEYEFKLEESKDDATISVTPRIPSLFHQIYDSPVDSQLWMLQDSNGKVLGYGGSVHEASAVSLNTKGGADYKLSLRISHPSRNVLEQLKDLPLRLSMKLSKELDCPVYSKMDKASTPGVTDDGRAPVKEVSLRRGAQCDLYVTRPTAKLPDWVLPGDVMTGTIQLNQKSPGVTSLGLFYDLPPKSTVSDGSKKKDDKKKDSDDETKILEELTESIFKAKVSHLTKLRGKKKVDAYNTLAEDLKNEKADSLPLLQELLTNATESKAPDDITNEKRWRATAVAAAVDAMSVAMGGPIDEAALAQYYGCNNPPPDDDADEEAKEEAEKIKKEMDERRKAWRSALLTKAYTWSDTVVNITGDEEASEEDKAAMDAAVKELKKWVNSAGDLSDNKEKVRHAILLSRHTLICQGKRVGSLASLRKARKDLPPASYKELTEEILKVMEGVDGMEYWLHQIKEDNDGRFPTVKQQIL